MNTKVFEQIDRERAKIGVSPQTLAYIETLEAIAEAGFCLWIQLGQAKEKHCANDLYDELAKVDFMHEEDEQTGEK
jgi:hypothetical protein